MGQPHRAGSDGRSLKQTAKTPAKATTVRHRKSTALAGNLLPLQKVHRLEERYSRKMLSSRTCKGNVPWEPVAVPDDPVETSNGCRYPEAEDSLHPANRECRERFIRCGPTKDIVYSDYPFLLVSLAR